ncbi:hypothetical protein DLAC_07916 [Tieghemostelium lacteum]|uniref:t-SNARE coiled-coil homology domain-containing protein n=1 Tax=Tieghemostelium lacteum TaxID=361077 RepID=A0A151ZAP8_TIELA|nr:hypothetical protein DLAC_07916 [Tieghemostelium lacteum]|eukprot:KYQ91017.1 hypothetical protein DLAC_07916 [Tieghemostelium lacteum]
MDSDFSNRKKNTKNLFDDDFDFGSRGNKGMGNNIPNNNGSFGKEQLMEQQNDKYYDNINNKITDLKRVTIPLYYNQSLKNSYTYIYTTNQISLDIESQVQESNTLLERIESELHSASSLLSNTMKKLNDVSKTATSRHMLFLILFVVFIFLFVYMLKGWSSKP